jgi:hypothetical protein
MKYYNVAIINFETSNLVTKHSQPAEVIAIGLPHVPGDGRSRSSFSVWLGWGPVQFLKIFKKRYCNNFVVI